MNFAETSRPNVPNKVLLLGDSGAGKTCCIATLANAGYRLFVLDFDNGLEAWYDPKILKPEFRDKIFFRTLTDDVSGVRGKGSPFPQAFTTAISLLDDWKEPYPSGITQSLGNPGSWSPSDVLVIDSLTFMSEAAMRYAQALSGHIGGKKTQPDYGVAIELVEACIQKLYSSATKCNVVVATHLRFMEGDTADGVSRAYPSAIGKKLPPILGRYFNSVLLVERIGVGSAARRILRTQSSLRTDLKNPAPSVVPEEMEADLAKYFALVNSPEVQGALQAPATGGAGASAAPLSFPIPLKK